MRGRWPVWVVPVLGPPVQYYPIQAVGRLPAVHHPSALDLHTQVAAVERGEPVGDHDRGAATHQPFHRLHDRLFGRGVDGAGGLIEDQYRGVLEERSRKRDALTLAAGQTYAALPHRGPGPR